LDQLLIVIGSVVRAVKSHSSGKKPNFDPKPQKSRNDSSYQLLIVIGSVVRAVKSHSSGKKPNFDPKPQKSRNDSSYQLILQEGELWKKKNARPCF